MYLTPSTAISLTLKEAIDLTVDQFEGVDSRSCAFFAKKTGGHSMGPIYWGGSNNTHFFLVIFRDFRENMCIVWVGNVMTPEKDIQRFEMSKVMAICYFSFRYKRIQIKDIYVVYLKQAIHDLLMLLLLLLFLVKKQRSPKVVDFGG